MVAEYCVATPPTNDPDRVQVDACCEERHCPSCSEGVCTGILRCEDNDWSRGADHSLDGCRDLGAADGEPLLIVVHSCKRSCDGDTMTSKV